MTYTVCGKINTREIKAKTCKNMKKAQNYLDSILDENGLEVEEILHVNNATVYVCNDYSRIMVLA